MFRKALIGLMVVLSISWFLLGAVIDLTYYNNLPRNPNNDTGQTNQVIVNHGSERFGTAKQIMTIRLVHKGLPIAGVVFAVTLFVGFKLGVIQMRGKAK